MLYDGDNLNISWEISGKDTCEIFRQIISDQQQRIYHFISVGDVWFKGTKYSMYDGRSEGMVTKKGSNIKYTVPFARIPIVVNGVEWLKFTFDSLYIDSILFVNTGRNSVDYTEPVAFMLSNDTICWRKPDLKIENDSVRLSIVFKGDYDGLFSFSRYTLQQKDNFASAWLSQVVRNIFYTIPFWLLWLFAYTNRNQVRTLDRKLYSGIIVWIPRLAAFYYVAAFFNLFREIEELQIGDSSVSSSTYFNLIFHRAIGIIVFTILFFAAKFWRRNSQHTGLIFCRKFLGSLLLAVIVYTLWGFVNYLTVSLLPEVQYNSGFYDCMLLNSPHKYPYGLIIPGYILFFVCLYYLFRFNKNHLLAFCLMFLFLFALEMASALSKLSDSDSGIQNDLNWTFLVHSFLFLSIPIVLTLTLLYKINAASENEMLLASSGALSIITFCCYSVSSPFLFLYIPVTFIMALIIWYFLFTRGVKQRIEIVSTGRRIFDLAEKNSKTYFRLFELKQLEKIKDKYLQKFNSGEMTPAEYDQAVDGVSQKITAAYGGDESNKTLLRRMEYGVFRSYWKNAERGGNYAAVISACVLLFIYAKVVLDDNPAYLGYDREGALILMGMKFIFAGLTLGYFFPFIKGEVGWKKGLFVGLAITAAELPYNYLTADRVSFQLLIAPFISNIFIMTLTGFLAFDLKTIKEIYGKNFKLKHIAQVEGWKNITALSSIIIGAIIAAASAFLAGNISSLLQNFIDK